VRIGDIEVAVDRDLCIGAGMCVMSAPEAFDQDDDGVVVVLETAVSPASPAHADAVARAVAGCPSGALRRADA
jgi:ferredoxin